jgi:predicted Zn-dependent peptidase
MEILKMKNRFFIFLFVVLFSTPVFSQVDRSKVPEAGPPPEIKIGNYDSFQLPNGLKVFVVENHKIPRVSYSLVLDIDPILEGENTGYVSIAGQLLRTGTKSRTKDQIDEQIDFIGASLSTSATGISGSSLTDHTEELFEIMSGIILNADFKKEELEKLRKQELSALAQQKDDPDAIASTVSNVLMYGKDHPYGEPETEETVKSITLNMCNEYYKTYFKPNVAYLAIVGDITKDKAGELVKKYLGNWEKGDVPKHEYKTPKAPLVRKVAIVDRPQAVQSVIRIGYPINLEKGSKDVIPASVANTILGGSFLSRLNNNLREVHGYTYGAGSSISSDELVGHFTAAATVRNSVTDSALSQFMDELKNMRYNKVTSEELESTKNYMTGSFARSLENPQTVARFALNSAVYDLPKDYYKNYLKNLNDVTVSDVQNMSKKYIKPNNSYVLVVGNADEIASKVKKFSVSGKIEYYDIYGNKYDPSMKNLPEGVTAESVIDSYIEAIGGRGELEKVKDKTMKLKGTTRGINISITMYQKFPNKFLQELDAGVFKQKTVFDGEKGKTVAGGQEIELSGDRLEDLKANSILNAFLDYGKHNITPELSGMDKVNGNDAYKVTLTLPSGDKMYNYYDVDSGYLVRQVSTVKSQQGSFTQTIDFKDYKEVDGIMYPFSISQQMGPQSIELQVDTIEVNSDLNDSLFEIQ